eukprot:TRINITY_DN2919_c1_g1_i1.p1 TRINITY_DN2919_c1_g1~~TRINITY_DN2919_c1_g1_i1.p1  ORF type:complete len:287 (+),score=95.46 TRINITY_DN2919_c1_g1_i1:19-879(+)
MSESKGKKITKEQAKQEEHHGIHTETKAQHPHGKLYNSKNDDAPIRKIVVAESLTAGKVADLLASHDNAGNFFIGSMSVYTKHHKNQLLDVDKEHAGKVDCVSPKVASEMASGILEMFRTKGKSPRRKEDLKRKTEQDNQEREKKKEKKDDKKDDDEKEESDEERENNDEPEVGVGVTGFAITDGVEDLEPHAYYCITTVEGEKRQGRIEKGLKGKSRNEVRRIVAERVYLEACKVIGLKPHEEVAKNHSNTEIDEEEPSDAAADEKKEKEEKSNRDKEAKTNERR